VFFYATIICSDFSFIFSLLYGYLGTVLGLSLDYFRPTLAVLLSGFLKFFYSFLARFMAILGLF
jgi:hypothetical protein